MLKAASAHSPLPPEPALETRRHERQTNEKADGQRRAPGTTSNPAPSKPTTIHKIYPVPFLTWRLSWEQDARTSRDVDQSLIQVLDKISTDLASGTLGKHHPSITQCAKDEFMSRINITSELKAEEHQAASNLGSEPNGQRSAPSDTQRSNSIPGASTGNESMDEQSLVLSGVLDLVIGRIIEIWAGWLPRETSASIHPVCTRFWGALDTIFRVSIAPHDIKFRS